MAFGRTKIPVWQSPRRRWNWWVFVVSLGFLSWSAPWRKQRAPSSNRIFVFVDAFHDCVQSRKRARNRRSHRKHRRLWQHQQQDHLPSMSTSSPPCRGGICVGMTNGPHQGGNASYPLAWNGTAGTRLESYMTVPEYPSGLKSKEDFSQITYYIWTDVFFGDESFGRMNQLVPQLILGSALDGSSGPPDFEAEWKAVHTQWAFGAHYFFEVWNPATNTTDAHAAYGKLFPADPGETLLTTFELSLPPKALSPANASSAASSPSPAWTLTMSVVGDPKRKSVLTVPEPYMGMGKDWNPKPSTSWLEPNFRNLCINACWELYGASDAGRLPSSGAEYRMIIEQPLQQENTETSSDADDSGLAREAAAEASNARPLSNSKTRLRYPKNDDESNGYTFIEAPLSADDWIDPYYHFTTWEQDEGNGVCPSCTVSEVHSQRMQEVLVEIDVSGSDGALKEN